VEIPQPSEQQYSLTSLSVKPSEHFRENTSLELDFGAPEGFENYQRIQVLTFLSCCFAFIHLLYCIFYK
jgi:hypothetical protein